MLGGGRSRARGGRQGSAAELARGARTQARSAGQAQAKHGPSTGGAAAGRTARPGTWRRGRRCGAWAATSRALWEAWSALLWRAARGVRRKTSQTSHTSKTTPATARTHAAAPCTQGDVRPPLRTRCSPMQLVRAGSPTRTGYRQANRAPVGEAGAAMLASPALAAYRGSRPLEGGGGGGCCDGGHESQQLGSQPIRPRLTLACLSSPSGEARWCAHSAIAHPEMARAKTRCPDSLPRPAKLR